MASFRVEFDYLSSRIVRGRIPAKRGTWLDSIRPVSTEGREVEVGRGGGFRKRRGSRSCGVEEEIPQGRDMAASTGLDPTGQYCTPLSLSLSLSLLPSLSLSLSLSSSSFSLPLFVREGRSFSN